MKKLFFASLWALSCLAAACSDEKDEPNDESGSIVGEWVFQRNEYYRNGKLVDSFTAVEEEDKAIAIFGKTEPIVITISRPRSITTGPTLMTKCRAC